MRCAPSVRQWNGKRGWRSAVRCSSMTGMARDSYWRNGARCWKRASAISGIICTRCTTGAIRTGAGQSLGGDRSGVQDARQAALVPRRDALDRTRRASDPEFAHAVAERNALGSVLAQDRAIWRTENRQLLNIKWKPHPKKFFLGRSHTSKGPSRFTLSRTLS